MNPKRLMLFSLSSALMSVVMSGISLRCLDAGWLDPVPAFQAGLLPPAILLDEAPQPSQLMVKVKRVNLH